ncbi:RNA polymerase sigma-70 factor [Hydrogenophaga palleronii]|uniref:RNA polymerase sigma-70 factor n=1 Tax=Hydrogenophaga palleronii TaxID=65655 RepID=UPI0008252DA0|nr:RNA polymerase sigma-70 factor [Hydrogenophaga palleronii]
MNNDPISTFNRLRPRLQGIAYRMLGSPAEAEDVVQDAWLRWHKAPHDALDSSEAWLVTVTTRLAIDRLRSAKQQREHYVGTWLPEPELSGSPPTPEQMLERADDVSVAFLALLERLAPEARAAFLLREVFDADYGEVAQALGKTESACRQIVHRAKAQLQDDRPRHSVPRDAQLRLLRGFADAASSGQLGALRALLAEDAQLIGDGGGKVPSFGVPIMGDRRIGQLFCAMHRRFGDAVRYEVVVLNGQWGLLRFIHGGLESAQSFVTDGERIQRVHVQRNPDKLARIAAALGRELAVTHTRP